MNVEINKHLDRFRRLVETNIEFIVDLSTMDSGLDDDWLQASWEIFVEAPLRKENFDLYLEPYGDGADCNGASSRVWQPDALPTHSIRVSTRGQKLDCYSRKFVSVEDAQFENFYGIENEKYDYVKPINYVSVREKDDLFLFRIEDVEFFIKIVAV